jgi:acyl carrier protein
MPPEGSATPARDPGALRAWLIETLRGLAPEYQGAFTDDTPLTEGGIGLDSLALIDLVGAVNDRLELYVSETEITEEQFGTVGLALRFLATRLA